MSRTALIVIDMINAYDHPDAEPLTKSVEKVLPTIEDLIARSDLTIYVNDNFGHWHSNRDDGDEIMPPLPPTQLASRSPPH